MTAILKRGDKIHMAMGVDLNSPLELKDQAAQILRELRLAYGAYGVEVVTLTCNTLLNYPIVVSVFRDEQAVKP